MAGVACAEVKLREIASQYRLGPSVNNDVVHRQHQQVIVVAQYQQGGNERRRLCQINFYRTQLSNHRFDGRVTLIGGDLTKCHHSVVDRQADGDSGSHPLANDACHGGERASQALVTLYQCSEGLAQRHHVERPRNVHHHRPIQRCTTLDLGVEPQSLLHARQRMRPIGGGRRCRCRFCLEAGQSAAKGLVAFELI